MKNFALALLVLLAAALLPVSAQAAPPDQPAWSVSGFLHDLWSLMLDEIQGLWQDGHAMVDPVGSEGVQDGGPMIDPIGQDGDQIESVTANGHAMIDPIGLDAPISPPEPEAATSENAEDSGN